MTTVEQLKRKRAHAKGRFTRFINYLSAAVEDDSYDLDTIKSIYDDVKDAWTNLNESMNRICRLPG